jgi:hypothetical protein
MTISVDASVKVQRRVGKKPCLWCRRELELRRPSDG